LEWMDVRPTSTVIPTIAVFVVIIAADTIVLKMNVRPPVALLQRWNAMESASILIPILIIAVHVTTIVVITPSVQTLNAIV